MIDDMRIFRTTIAVAHLARPDDRRTLVNVMVDTGSEYNWIPRAVLEDLGVAQQRVDRFETADGRALERDVGFTLLYAGGRSAVPAALAGTGNFPKARVEPLVLRVRTKARSGVRRATSECRCLRDS